jgi:hypothetical protein
MKKAPGGAIMTVMLMPLVWFANAVVIAVAVGAAYLIKANGWEFGLGVIAASCVYNLCHKIIYGRWL